MTASSKLEKSSLPTFMRSMGAIAITRAHIVQQAEELLFTRTWIGSPDDQRFDFDDLSPAERADLIREVEQIEECKACGRMRRGLEERTCPTCFYDHEEAAR